MRTGSTYLTATMALLVVWVVGAAGIAHANEGYRYWSYWTVTDQAWGYAQVGPASTLVRDGDVHGWSFGVSTADGAMAPTPRTDPANAFARICSGTPAVAGSARVAVIIDFGTKEVAPTVEVPPQPRWSCVVVPEQSTGAAVISQVAQLRLDNGFVCGIDGFPASECSVAATPPLEAQDTIDVIDVAINPTVNADDAIDTSILAEPSEGDPLPLIIGGGVIVLGLLTAWALQKRSGRTS
jgi:hypothetical protein